MLKLNTHLCLATLFLTVVFINSKDKLVETATKDHPKPPPRSSKIRQTSSAVKNHRHRSMSKTPLSSTKKTDSSLMPKHHTKNHHLYDSNLIIFKNQYALPVYHVQFALMAPFCKKTEIFVLVLVCKYFCIHFIDLLNLEKNVLRLNPKKAELHQLTIRRLINANFILDPELRHRLRDENYSLRRRRKHRHGHTYGHGCRHGPREQDYELKKIINEISAELPSLHSQVIYSNNGSPVMDLDAIYSKLGWLFSETACTIGRFLLLEYSKRTKQSINRFQSLNSIFEPKLVEIVKAYKKFAQSHLESFHAQLTHRAKVDEGLYRQFSSEMRQRGIPFWNYQYASDLLFRCTIQPIKQILFWDIFHTVEFVLLKVVLGAPRILDPRTKNLPGSVVLDEALKEALEHSYDTHCDNYMIETAFDILEVIEDGLYSVRKTQRHTGTLRNHVTYVKKITKAFLNFKIYAPTKIAVLI